MNSELGGDYLTGLANAEAAAAADIVILSVPYRRASRHPERGEKPVSGQDPGGSDGALAAARDHPSESAGRRRGRAGSASAPRSRSCHVVAAFQNVSAVKLKQLGQAVDCDVLVCADDKDARTTAIELVAAAGMRGMDAGGLKNAVAAESLTPVLLHINKTYGVQGAGIRITGLDDGK